MGSWEFCGIYKKTVGGEWFRWLTAFSTPTTNNPLESYNAIIKAFFTQRAKLNKVEMWKVFFYAILYVSSKLFNYEFFKIKQVDYKHLKRPKLGQFF